METSKNPWPIASTFGIRNRIDTNPDFQRPPVWGRAQKQLLIDTILRKYDVPKFYWRKTGKSPDTFDVVDGQQRLRAIWEFQAGEYRLPKDSDPIDGYPVAGVKYDELPDELRIRFDTYALDVVVLTDTDEEEVREMFLRLQNGTSLKAQEKRNAMSGQMREFVKGLASHPFFANCRFSNARYTYDHIAAQMTLIELEGGPTNIKDRNLNLMYEEHRSFDLQGPVAKRVRRVLDTMLKMFPEKTPELERYSVVSLYILLSHLLQRFVVSGRESEIAAWFIEFERIRRSQEILSEDDADPEYIVYKEKTSHSTDAVDSLTWRHDFLMRKLLESMPDLEQKDDQRLFTHEQRMAIFRRDKGVCQVRRCCEGAQCSWDAWEADHKVAWSAGGKTTVANGQVACLACNRAKGAS